MVEKEKETYMVKEILKTLTPTLEESKILVPKGTCLLGWRGSIAHGLYLDPNDPSSVDDKDLMGICLGEPKHYVGLRQWGSQGTKEIKHEEWDVVYYDAKKMFSLLLQGNPNVVSLLWMDPEYYLIVTPAGQQILDNRQLFCSKQMWKAFEGYAWSQHERMKRGEFKGHMGAKRKALFDQHGYDCKAAAHMIRLVRMARDLYTTGQLVVLRPDSRELLAIKQGQHSLETVEEMFARTIEAASAACKSSSLPQEPDYAAAEVLLEKILQEHLMSEWGAVFPTTG
jgi:uncharacterized protein